MSDHNTPWNLESFVDALVVELDNTRETLALKAINKPLSYSVKGMSLDLNIFPTYNGNEVKFTTAGVGEEGASKLAIQLSSITDRQVRETSKAPASADDITLDKMEIDESTKRELKKIGVRSVTDIEKMEQKNVDLAPATKGKVSYIELANLIRKNRRDQTPPEIHRAGLTPNKLNRRMTLTLEGDALSPDKNFKPIASINGMVLDNESQTQHSLSFSLDPETLIPGQNELLLVTDPYSIIKMNVENPGEPL